LGYLGGGRASASPKIGRDSHKTILFDEHGESELQSVTTNHEIFLLNENTIFRPLDLYPVSKHNEIMHSWGFALREGVFAETKEGICRNKNNKDSFKSS